jgi:hypothetical protein
MTPPGWTSVRRAPGCTITPLEAGLVRFIFRSARLPASVAPSVFPNTFIAPPSGRPSRTAHALASLRCRFRPGPVDRLRDGNGFWPKTSPSGDGASGAVAQGRQPRDDHRRQDRSLYLGADGPDDRRGEGRPDHPGRRRLDHTGGPSQVSAWARSRSAATPRRTATTAPRRSAGSTGSEAFRAVALEKRAATRKSRSSSASTPCTATTTSSARRCFRTISAWARRAILT